MPASGGTRSKSRTIPAPRRTQAALVKRAAVPCEIAMIAALARVNGRLRQGYHADSPRNANTMASGRDSAAAWTIEYADGRARSAVRTAPTGSQATRYGSSLPFLARIGCISYCRFQLEDCRLRP